MRPARPKIHIYLLPGFFFFFSEWETRDLLLAVITLLKEASTSDRSIYYANYTFKSTANAKPKVESAVITGARTVSHRSACDKRLKKKKENGKSEEEENAFIQLI